MGRSVYTYLMWSAEGLVMCSSDPSKAQSERRGCAGPRYCQRLLAIPTVMTSTQNGAGKDTLPANGKPGVPGPGSDDEADDEIEWLQYHRSFEARGYSVRPCNRGEHQ